MTAPLPLPDRLVDRIERATTGSAAVLRRIVYDVLAEFGVDTERLARDSKMDEVERRREAVKRAVGRVKLLRSRVASGQLEPEKEAEALARLLQLPPEIKAQKAALKRLEHRPLPRLPSAPTRELVRQMGREPVVQEREANGELLSSEKWHGPRT